MVISDFFLAEPPLHVRVDHLAHDGSWADDGDLYHYVVEALRTVARQGGHLCAAFHLKHSHRIGTFQHFIDLRVVLRKLSQVEWLLMVPGYQFEAVFEHGHHAEAKQIDLDNLQVSTVFLIPLDDGAPRHRGPFQRNNRSELPRADHHAARVLPEMTRKVLQPLADVQVGGDTTMMQIETSSAETVVQCVCRTLPFPGTH